MSVSAGVASPAEGLTCFVCDGTVVGRYYTLASCKTQVSKQKLVEKLGQLVGEQYMVVISEDDIICRSCTTMLNNLDRLEKEMSSVRSVILRFLEKKYELEEGELLLNSKVTLPPPPTPPEAINAFKKVDKLQSFHERKKQSEAAMAQTGTKSNVWLQCDRCHYTTPYSSFMINHIHKHSEPVKPAANTQKALEEANTVTETEQAQTGVVTVDVEATPMTAVEEVLEPEQPIKTEETKQEEIETLSIVTNGEHTTGEGEVEDVGVVEEDTVVVNEYSSAEGGQLETVEAVDVMEEGAEGEATTVVEMDMQENICMVDENGVVIQKVQQAEDGNFYVVEGDIDGSKQMLSVSEDGTVQMVQVMWDEMGTADENMQF